MPMVRLKYLILKFSLKAFLHFLIKMCAVIFTRMEENIIRKIAIKFIRILIAFDLLQNVRSLAMSPPVVLISFTSLLTSDDLVKYLQ
jgi:hypothetical protein